MHFLHRLRTLASLLAAATVLALTACGGGDESAPAPVQLDSSRIARATLDATGGSITATAADGRRYTLTVPAGALSAATEITATPVVSMGSAPLAAGLRGAVRFGPAGLRLAVPATLRIEGAGAAAPTGTTLVGFVRSGDGTSMQLVPPAVVAGALQMDVRHFSDAGVSQATAQEVAQVPVDAAADPVDALVDEHLRAGSAGTPSALSLIRLHDARVAPQLTVAESAGVFSVAEREVAVAVAQAWFAMVKISFEADTPDAALPGGLGSVASALRQRVLALITRSFEFGLSVCVEPDALLLARVEAVRVVLLAERQVASFRNLGGLPGLDPETVKRRLNDCVRVAFVPRTPPTFEVGRPVSLDAQAQLVFAADPNAAFPVDLVRVDFAFAVNSDDGTIATPTGLAAADGTYTTVVTPRIANPAFGVEACVVPSFDLLPSVLCGRQTVRGAAVEPTSVVLAGRATRTLDVVNASAGTSATERGTVDLRVRADADGGLTVIEAAGSVRRESSGTVVCRPDPLSTATRTVTLTATHQHTITSGRFVADAVRPGFEFSGPTTTTQQVIPDPNLGCVIETIARTIDDGNDFGLARIIARELATDGLPASFTLGDFTGAANGAIQGRLLRE